MVEWEIEEAMCTASQRLRDVCSHGDFKGKFMPAKYFPYCSKCKFFVELEAFPVGDEYQ